MTARQIVFFAIAFGTIAAPAAAQERSRPAPPPSMFSQVIKQPTGKNGYEELVAAADLVNSSKLYQQTKDGPTTLAFKRSVLLDRPISRALNLVKQAQTKPVFSPRESLGLTTLLPEFSVFRDIARLIVLRQYVLLADGRTVDAIQDARLCLWLGRSVQTDTLISGLVGIAISSLGIKNLGAHLDQFSARDFELLNQLCVEWLQQPSPMIPIIQAERKSQQVALAEMREAVAQKGPAALKELLGYDDKEVASAAQFIGSKEAIDQIYAETVKRLDEHMARTLAEARKPAWERKKVEFTDDGTPAAKAAGLLVPALERVMDAYSREEAQVRLLACHCAIRRFRWEYDRLPESLEQVRLGSMALDPFTGQPLHYSASGHVYELTSVGPEAPDDPKAVNGRRPVTITPE
jgi:hypothetical protein